MMKEVWVVEFRADGHTVDERRVFSTPTAVVGFLASGYGGIFSDWTVRELLNFVEAGGDKFFVFDRLKMED